VRDASRRRDKLPNLNIARSVTVTVETAIDLRLFNVILRVCAYDGTATSGHQSINSSAARRAALINENQQRMTVLIFTGPTQTYEHSTFSETNGNM